MSSIQPKINLQYTEGLNFNIRAKENNTELIWNNTI